ncbi:MAG TPA: hypothetical protein VHN74_15625 [Candidatus Angelobacter sp.]|jgi:hypothetical protein|nr:hypothetical protein [Candidatus Angelobacter sp.]
MALMHTPTSDAELSDLLDRMLDKGLVFGSADALLVRFEDLSALGSRVTVEAMRTYFSGWMPPELRSLGPQRIK